MRRLFLTVLGALAAPAFAAEPPKLDLTSYPYLPRANVEATSAASYMALMTEAAE